MRVLGWGEKCRFLPCIGKEICALRGFLSLDVGWSVNNRDKTYEELMADKAKRDEEELQREFRYFKRRKKITILSTCIGVVSGLMVLGVAALTGGGSIIWNAFVLAGIVVSFYSTGKFILGYGESLILAFILFAISVASALTVEIAMVGRGNPPMIATFLGIILVPVLAFINAFVAIRVEHLDEISR